MPVAYTGRSESGWAYSGSASGIRATVLMNYSFFLRWRRRIVARRVVDGDTVFLRGRRGIAVRDALDGDAVFLRGRFGAAVREVVDGDTVFLLGRLEIAARDLVDGATVLGSVDATDTRLGVAAGNSTGVGVDKTVGDSTGCTVPTG